MGTPEYAALHKDVVNLLEALHVRLPSRVHRALIVLVAHVGEDIPFQHFWETQA